MTTLYLLDIPELEPFVKVAIQDPDVTFHKLGPFFEISKDGVIVIERRATGCRPAVWYSAIAGLRDARVAQHDRETLRVEPS